MDTTMIKIKNSNKTIVFKKKSLILYAPGVHTGGGFVLIKNIIDSIKNSIIFVDERLKLDSYDKSNVKIKSHIHLFYLKIIQI